MNKKAAPDMTANAIFLVENLTRNRTVANNIYATVDSASRRRGLLHVTDLDRDSGLWIKPCEGIHTFGMKIRLDAVFMDATLRVRQISAGLKPNRIAFCLFAHSVLEIRAGGAAESEIQCGDQLLIRRIF